jgi:hypothetical protein
LTEHLCIRQDEGYRSHSVPPHRQRRIVEVAVQRYEPKCARR